MAKISFNSLETFVQSLFIVLFVYFDIWENNLNQLQIRSLSGHGLLAPCQNKVKEAVELGVT